MAKPIFIIELPDGEENQIETIKNYLEEKLNDYHVLIVWGGKVEEIKYNVYYEKDMTDIKFEELKDIVNESINNFDIKK